MRYRTKGPGWLIVATVLCGLAASARVEAGWAHSDIGAVGVTGAATISKNGRIKVSGEGTDIASTADGFHYLYQQLPADGAIVVRMASLQNTSAWAKGGVMLRQNLTAGSIHASLLVTPSSGILFQRRTSAGGTTTSATTGGSTPRWLQLTRSGTTISAAVSSDGVTWNGVGTASVPFSGAIYVGMAVTSNRRSRLATAQFESVTLSTANAARSVTSGLVAAWSFDEGSGSIASDQLGVSNGTIEGAAWTASGRFGSALVFDGLGSTVTVADRAALDLSGAMTLEAWLYPVTLSAWRSILMKENSGGSAYALYANADGAVPSGFVTTSNADVQVQAPVQLPVGKWSHIAVTYDGTVLRLYVNGAVAGSQNATGALVQTTGALRIGGNTLWGEYFHGGIDNVRIYERALTSTEIQKVMAMPVESAKPAQDTTPPSVIVTAPASGSTLSGLATVSASASDDVGVRSVQLLINGSSLGSALASTPYARSWDTTTAPNGTYVITAVARDAAGNEAVSAPVTVTVKNETSTTPSNPRLVEFSSPDHNTILPGGEAAVTGYTLEVWQAGANPSTSEPYRSTQIGKPQSTSTLISVDQKAFLGSLPTGQEYFTTVVASGPGGSARSSASNRFVVY